MNHPTEQDLILHYYAEGENLVLVEQHLVGCPACRGLYTSLDRTLTEVNALPVPERGGGYGAQVWARIEGSLPNRTPIRFRLPLWRWAIAGVAVPGLLVLAFLTGRFYPARPGHVPIRADAPSEERILGVAVGDHLERSQIVLTELANTTSAGPLDISFDQQRAVDLLDENRLYRQTAIRSGDANLASVLDELERVLLEIAHAPSQISPAELNELRLRLEADGILFKLRVLGSNVRNRQERAPQRPL